MLRCWPTAWRERPSSITPNANATTPAAWPNPKMKGLAITAGAATVWMAACAPKGIVVRVLLITTGRLRTYVRIVCACGHRWTGHLSRTPGPTLVAWSARAFAARTIRAMKVVARDQRIPKPLQWITGLALLPIPGPVDEVDSRGVDGRLVGVRRAQGLPRNGCSPCTVGAPR